MSKKNPQPPGNDVAYLLVDRDGVPIIIAKSELIAEQWSEEGFGDYRELKITNSWFLAKELGGVDERARRD